MSEWDKKLEVMQLYDSTAHLYDMRYAEEQKAKFEAALKNLGKDRYGLVLDAGCGTGLLFHHVALNSETIIGLEISGKILLKAKERAKNFKKVHLILADADHMPFEENSFDTVFVFTLIQNMPDPSKTLKEVKRVAKDNAVFIITGLKKAFSLENLEKLLCNSGLKIISIKNNDLKCYVSICTKLFP